VKSIQPLVLATLFLTAACGEAGEAVGPEKVSSPPVEVALVDTNIAALASAPDSGEGKSNTGQSDTGQSDTGQSKPAAPTIDLNALYSEDARGVDMLLGSWAESAEGCAQGVVLVFEADTYRDLGGGGRWKASGNEIRIAYRTDASGSGGVRLENEMVYRVLALAPDRLLLTDDNRGDRRLQICD